MCYSLSCSFTESLSLNQEPKYLPSSFSHALVLMPRIVSGPDTRMFFQLWRLSLYKMHAEIFHAVEFSSCMRKRRKIAFQYFQYNYGQFSWDVEDVWCGDSLTSVIWQDSQGRTCLAEEVGNDDTIMSMQLRMIRN